MADDLSAFVTTAAHRNSVEALRKHRFVLLLGDPASGKSTIGACLALGALDDGAVGTVRVSTAEDFEHHWNPREPSQFFWIDDAFGETQYQRGRVDGWNTRLKLLRAAVKSGAHVLMTSRTYIFNAARRDLKTSEFPLLVDSQVMIDVQGLSDVERAQILYNHMRRGDQTKKWRGQMKPFLPAIATNRNFLPETARRLGTSFFTRDLQLTLGEITAFVERPIEFLKGVLRTLAESDRAAIALIFLHGPGGVPSPITASRPLETISRLSGVDTAELARAMEALRGSLTALVESEEGSRWAFKHPTIADAYASLVAESPEMVELYVRGAKLEKLLSEVVCSSVRLTGASVRVPRALYDLLLARLAEKGLRHKDVLRFLASRTDAAFLARIAGRKDDLLQIAANINSEMRWNPELRFLCKLHGFDLLPDEVRSAATDNISRLTLTWADSTAFSSHEVRALFTAEELQQLENRFETEILDRYGLRPEEWDQNFSTDSRVQLMNDLEEAIAFYAALRPEDAGLQRRAAASRAAISAYSEAIEEDEQASQPYKEQSAPPALQPPEQIATIFDDVDG